VITTANSCYSVYYTATFGVQKAGYIKCTFNLIVFSIYREIIGTWFHGKLRSMYADFIHTVSENSKTYEWKKKNQLRVTFLQFSWDQHYKKQLWTNISPVKRHKIPLKQKNILWLSGVYSRNVILVTLEK
jgi:hypothetical protein